MEDRLFDIGESVSDYTIGARLSNFLKDDYKIYSILKFFNELNECNRDIGRFKSVQNVSNNVLCKSD